MITYKDPLRGCLGCLHVAPFSVFEKAEQLRSRGWHTVRQSAPTVWLRCPRDHPGPNSLGCLHVAPFSVFEKASNSRRRDLCITQL